MPVFYMGICLIGILWFHRFPRLNYTPLLQTLTNCLFKPLLHMASLSIISDVGFCFQIFLKLVFLLGSTLHFCLVFPWTKKHENDWRPEIVFSSRSWRGYCDMMGFKTSTLLSMARHRWRWADMGPGGVSMCRVLVGAPAWNWMNTWLNM